MLTHIILLRFEDRTLVDEALRRAEALERAEPILRLKAGRDVVAGDGSFDMAVIVRLVDRAGLTELEAHPLHEDWVAFLATAPHSSARVLMADEWTHT